MTSQTSRFSGVKLTEVQLKPDTRQIIESVKKEDYCPSPLPAPKPRPCKIEAVIASTNYADFLVHTLPYVRTQFDRTVVVTAPHDKKTQDVCSFLNVECILSDAFRSHWGEFNKGAAINVGLEALDKDGWLVQLDSDIILPSQFKFAIECASLDKSYIYGIDRVMVKSFEDWQKFMQNPESQKQGDAFVHPRSFLTGHRLCIPEWVPIGFFQMWHSSTGRFTYPMEHFDAARGDVQFALQWARNKRALIPEWYAYHLESEDSPHGLNWLGRKSKIFGL